MSLRFGSGWLVIYFLICSCTFICSAPQLRTRDYRAFKPFETLPYSVTKPSSHSGRIVRKPYLGITSRLPSPAHNPATSQNRTSGKSMRFHFCGFRVYRYFADSSEAHALLCPHSTELLRDRSCQCFDYGYVLQQLLR